jgi:hypothetical protein
MSADSDSALSIERPFPGLRPFDYADHALFFGREDQSYALYGLLGLGQFVAIVGSSGSGKSSLVRAGLLPLLQRESDEILARGDNATAGRAWRWIELRPGHAPLSRLAEQLAELSSPTGGEDPVDRAVRRDRVSYALRRSSFGFSEALAGIEALSGRSLLVVVDQFEELFRYGGSGAELQRLREERMQFVQLLLEATSGRTPNLHVLITMRSDFIGDCAQFYGLPEAVSNCQFLVPSLTRDQREEVIRGPLGKADAAIEPALLERLLNDAGNDPGQLPVLQHCLLRLWEAAGPSRPASPRRRLDCGHYDDIGGLADALSRHADTILAELRGHELAVEQVFRALSEVDKEGRATRRALGYARLRAEAGISDAELGLVVDRFRTDDCSFLVPSVSAEPILADETRIDVGHEALLRRWEKISGESRQDIGEEGQRRGWLWAEEEDGALYRAWLMLGPGARLPDLQRRWEVWCTRPRTAAWAERYGGRLPEIEQLFRDNLVEAEAAEEAEAEGRRLAAEAAILRDEQLRLEQRRNRLLRLTAAGMAALAVAAAVLGGWAFHVMQVAKQQEAVAEEQSTEAENQRGIATQLANMQKHSEEIAMHVAARHKLDTGDAPSALLFDQQCVDMARRTYADDPSDDDKSYLALALGNLSWALEINNRPADALAASDEALKLYPSAVWIAANRAHALLLLGRYDEAKAIYIEDKDKPVFNGKFAAVVLKDFAELRKFGVDHPEMKWIEAQFAEGALTDHSAAPKGEPSAQPE